MSTYVVKGNAQAVSTGLTANAVVFTTPLTHTFEVTNASSTVYSYVGLFPTNVAATFVHPTVGTSGQGFIIPPNTSKTISLDAGAAYSGNVWAVAITATGSTTTFFTPVIKA